MSVTKPKMTLREGSSWMSGTPRTDASGSPPYFPRWDMCHGLTSPDTLSLEKALESILDRVLEQRLQQAVQNAIQTMVEAKGQAVCFLPSQVQAPAGVVSFAPSNMLGIGKVSGAASLGADPAAKVTEHWEDVEGQSARGVMQEHRQIGAAPMKSESGEEDAVKSSISEELRALRARLEGLIAATSANTAPEPVGQADGERAPPPGAGERGRVTSKDPFSDFPGNDLKAKLRSAGQDPGRDLQCSALRTRILKQHDLRAEGNHASIDPTRQNNGKCKNKIPLVYKMVDGVQGSSSQYSLEELPAHAHGSPTLPESNTEQDGMIQTRQAVQKCLDWLANHQDVPGDLQELIDLTNQAHGQFKAAHWTWHAGP